MKHFPIQSTQLRPFFSRPRTTPGRRRTAIPIPGLRQLARQFIGDRIEANYAEEDLVSGLDTSTVSILMLGYLVARITQQDREAAEIETLFGGGTQGQQPD